MALVTPASVFRRYVTAGVPDSGKHEPDKSEIIQLLDLLFGVSRGGWVVAKTRAELLGVTPDKETDGGVVLNDSNASYNGYYQRDGGAWVRERGFPDTFAKVELSGSGNAQTGAVAAGVNPAGVEVFFARVTTPNTGPLTLSISGGSARQVVNLAGNPLSAGEWTGTVMFDLNEDGQYHLLIDAGAAQAAAQSATEAEAAQVAAEAAAAAALAAVSGGSSNKATVALAAADAPDVDPEYYDIAYYDTNYVPGSGCKWRKRASDPGHVGAFQNGNGTWYEIDSPTNPAQLGAVGDGSDETEKLQALLDTAGSNYIDGGDTEYTVRSLYVNSGQRGKVLRLKTLAGSEDFRAPFTVDGNTVHKSDIVFDELYVDGNRQNQSDIVTPIEDGGRHGVRIVGHVRDVHFGILEANYCAGDGLAIFSDSGSGGLGDETHFVFENITIGILRTHWNRRHGSSFDCIRRLKVGAWYADKNGLDLPDTTEPLDHGARGARFGGNLYGRPFDFEDYGMGTRVSEIEVGSFAADGNYGGALFHSSTDVTLPGFIPRGQIHFGSFIQTSLVARGASYPGLTFNGPGNTDNPSWVDISIDNMQDVAHLLLIGADRASFRGRPGLDHYRALIMAQSGRDISLDFPGVHPAEIYSEVNPVFVLGESGASNASSISASVGNVGMQDGRDLELTVTYTAAGSGTSVIYLDLSTGWRLKSAVGATCIHNPTGAATPAFTRVTDANTLQVLATSVGAGVHVFQALVTVTPD